MAEFDNNRSFFEEIASAVSQDLMTLQLAAGSPEPTEGINTVSDPVIPDRLVRDRLGHFDPAIYDLRDESHLMKLLKVLLGAPGTGGLRKQLLVARLQNTFSGMHFLDLDRFYGALFGVKRTAEERYPNPDFDPYSQGASTSEWDDIHARDASYRDRLSKFSKTIPMGGTKIGIEAMAEALVSVDCEIYESWAILDELDLVENSLPQLIYLYSTLSSSFPSWGDMEGNIWAQYGGGIKLAPSRIPGAPTRSDFVVQPKRNLTPHEANELRRVLDRFKPAGTTIVVNPEGLSVHSPIAIRGVAADSEYWEVISRYTISSDLVVPPYYWGSYISGPNIEQQRPAFSQYQGDEWSYNDNIQYTRSSVIQNGQEPTGSVNRNHDIVRFSDGIVQDYQAADAILPGDQAMSARIVSDGIMTSSAYAVSRALVKEGV